MRCVCGKAFEAFVYNLSNIIWILNRREVEFQIRTPWEYNEELVKEAARIWTELEVLQIARAKVCYHWQVY